MPKPLLLQVRENRLQLYGFFILLLVSFFIFLGTNFKTQEYASAKATSKDDYSVGQVTLVTDADWAQNQQQVYAGCEKDLHCSQNVALKIVLKLDRIQSTEV